MRIENLSLTERVGAGLVAGALVVTLAGCGHDRSPEAGQTVAQSTSHGPEGASGRSPAATNEPSPSANPNAQTGNPACGEEIIPVFPFLYFKGSNAKEINKQLAALKVAHEPNAKVNLDDLIGAGLIVSHSLADPVYAEAFTLANHRIADQPVTARELLNVGFAAGDGGCLQWDQIHKAGELYKTLVNGLAPKVGRRLSAVVQFAYDQFLQGYIDFKQKYQQELNR